MLMGNETEILGYIKCNTCNEPKAIKQGKGKRQKFVHGRCACGPDTRTGVAAQAELSAFKPLAVIQREIDTQFNEKDECNIVEIKPNSDPQKKDEEQSKNKGEIGTVASVGAGVVVGLFFGGLIKLIKVVA